ncbi:DUF4064 domain-containing protein [Lederbergia lenta]|uniref:DUF4064 domain-containing protein n=1 Tax=Lederbergia lenta TaxID=1467 RepID=A0A2X4W8I4_LEDLE|nr:DUF4064 domain-containing protein [Lederbergia lenta]MCM3110253.1 DUF4064 domain-containing protein [Lederbergia lenta]MEC2324179.1 DUF4064 domain-containing protein [Lederbergia lenta]SQI60516.1 Uncharacterised protein [Lederbergia lenta]
MKRTGEFVLGIIGIILSALTIIGGIFFMWAANSNEIKNTLLEDPEIESMLNVEGLDIESIFAGMTGIGVALLIVAIIGIIFGIIAVISIKGNKSPKLAGSMFLVGAVLVGIISLGTAFLPALLYLIAGIMCFARKAPPETIEPTNF